MIGTTAKLLFTIVLFVTGHLSAQNIEGIVTDKVSGSALSGATVYLDGTANATITSETGAFSLTKITGSNTLVVSFVGYHTMRVEDVSQFAGRHLRIELDVNNETLGEVVVSKSPFSRKQMLEVFRNQFLGRSPAGRSCKIQNEDDITFFYNNSDHSLTATSRNPLLIKNSYLKYDIHFDLIEQVTIYKGNSLSPHDIVTSYFAGSTLYFDRSKRGNAAQRRYETYSGSAVHLMRTIAGNLWKQEGFSLHFYDKPLDPSEYFGLSSGDGGTKVTLLKKLLVKIKQITDGQVSEEAGTTSETFFTIRYKNRYSFLQFREPSIDVDSNGNYSPIYGLMFGGYIGSLKAGDMLPRDYYSETIAKQIKKD
jgi:hypothetical protein